MDLKSRLGQYLGFGTVLLPKIIRNRTKGEPTSIKNRSEIMSWPPFRNWNRFGRQKGQPRRKKVTPFPGSLLEPRWNPRTPLEPRSKTECPPLVPLWPLVGTLFFRHFFASPFSCFWYPKWSQKGPKSHQKSFKKHVLEEGTEKRDFFENCDLAGRLK